MLRARSTAIRKYTLWHPLRRCKQQLLFCTSTQTVGSVHRHCFGLLSTGAVSAGPAARGMSDSTLLMLACNCVSCLQTPEEERKRLLSFVVCGGGPTGVEVAAEMHDMIFDDLKVRRYRLVTISSVVLGLLPSVFPAHTPSSSVSWPAGWSDAANSVLHSAGSVPLAPRCYKSDLADMHARWAKSGCCCWRWLLQEHYPELMKDVKIRIIELMDHVLSTYDRAISIYTAEQFKRAGERGAGRGAG